MREFKVMEHIYNYGYDAVNNEITECVYDECFYNVCTTEKEVEIYVENINKVQPVDIYGRKRNLYVRWIDSTELKFCTVVSL
jgi:hypothetical protein